MKQSIKALIVDDERLARQRLQALLSNRSDIFVMKECVSGSEAVDAITKLKPDLVFLDVEMPELNGIEVVDCIGAERMPVVVFVTAYDHYAVRAFDIHAVDYLLKPFDRDRFNTAVERAIAEVVRRQTKPTQAGVVELLDHLKQENRVTRRILVRAGGKTSVLNISDIDWIESAGNYVRLHVGKKTHDLRETMNSVHARLDMRRFVRIHRTAIVNVDRISEIRPHFQGNAVVVLENGQRLPLSKSHQATLEAALQQ